MPDDLNSFGQPIGPALPAWVPRPLPVPVVLEGQYCRLEPLDPAHHAEALYEAYTLAPDDRAWTYMPYGPFRNLAAYRAHVEKITASHDPLQFAVIDRRTERPVGTFALMRQDAVNGVVEVGWVTFSSLLQRTPLSTEAQFLLMAHVFETLGYRRYEWKCDSLNGPSRKAALRLGFRFEGVFRQAVVYKERSRDTAWYAIVDGDWPALRRAFEGWLAPKNFDADGQQHHPLEAFRGR